MGQGQKILPGLPQRSDTRHKKNSGHGHADSRAIDCAPVKGQRDEKVDRSVFEKVNTVCEKRDRADGNRNAELHAEIREIQKTDDENSFP